MSDDFTSWLAETVARDRARQDDLNRAHLALVDMGLLSRVTLHRYVCKKHGCKLAVVYRAGGMTLCAVHEYTLSPGLNEATSVAAARASKTLDGDRHWPGHVYEVDRLEEFSPGATDVFMDLRCYHYLGRLTAHEVLAAVENITPGHPDAPTRL